MLVSLWMFIILDLCLFVCMFCCCFWIYYVTSGKKKKKKKNSKIARKAKGFLRQRHFLTRLVNGGIGVVWKWGYRVFFLTLVLSSSCCVAFCYLSINLHVVGHLSVQLIGSLGRLLLALTSTSTTTTTSAVTATGSSLSTLRLSLVVVVVASGSWCPVRERSGNVTMLERNHHYRHCK